MVMFIERIASGKLHTKKGRVYTNAYVSQRDQTKDLIMSFNNSKSFTWLLMKAPPPVLTKVSKFKEPIGTKLRISAMKIKTENPTNIDPRMKYITLEIWIYQSHSIY